MFLMFFLKHESHKGREREGIERIMDFRKRIECWIDTKTYCEASDSVHAPASKKVAYDPGFVLEKRHPETETNVIEMDTVEAALVLRGLGYDPLVHSFADHCFPGGCVEMGSASQEESIFRCTNISTTLRDPLSNRNALYPIESDECILSPGVSVLKRFEEHGWTPHDSPCPVLDFVSCPPLNQPTLDFPEKFYSIVDARLHREDEAIMRNKIRLMFQTAQKNGNDSLVLGASGCGSFKNPTKHIVSIYREELAKADGAFKRIDFAILLGAAKHFAVLSDHRIPRESLESKESP
jgi:uncharacterized protein (TIGR02452 family)